MSRKRIAQVVGMRGLIAFWDFHPSTDGSWTSARDPSSADRSYPLRLRHLGDPLAYDPAQWPYHGESDRLELRNEGPFGVALRCNQGHIYAEVARRDFDGTPLDLHGRRPFTLMAWTSFIGKRHLIAGIWDEGGWSHYGGRRQAALFAGLFQSKGVIAHLSETGAASFPQSQAPGAQFARLKAIDGRDFADRTWVCATMTFDGRAVDAWLDGVRTPCTYLDPVAAAVFGETEPHDVNPAPFPEPIWSPRAFLLKFNGYDRSTGIAEHRLRLDIDAGSACYGRTPPKAAGRWQVTLDLLRGGTSLLHTPHTWIVEPDAREMLPELRQARIGDVVVATLAQEDGDGWCPLGAPIRCTLTEGAPFTVGRALGLGLDDINRGSQLLLGGVAVFDRVLTASELAALSFCRQEDVDLPLSPNPEPPR